MRRIETNGSQLLSLLAGSSGQLSFSSFVKVSELSVLMAPYGTVGDLQVVVQL